MFFSFHSSVLHLLNSHLILIVSLNLQLQSALRISGDQQYIPFFHSHILKPTQKGPLLSIYISHQNSTSKCVLCVLNVFISSNYSCPLPGKFVSFPVFISLNLCLSVAILSDESSRYHSDVKRERHPKG